MSSPRGIPTAVAATDGTRRRDGNLASVYGCRCVPSAALLDPSDMARKSLGFMLQWTCHCIIDMLMLYRGRQLSIPILIHCLGRRTNLRIFPPFAHYLQSINSDANLWMTYSSKLRPSIPFVTKFGKPTRPYDKLATALPLHRVRVRAASSVSLPFSLNHHAARIPDINECECTDSGLWILGNNADADAAPAPVPVPFPPFSHDFQST